MVLLHFQFLALFSCCCLLFFCSKNESFRIILFEKTSFFKTLLYQKPPQRVFDKDTACDRQACINAFKSYLIRGMIWVIVVKQSKNPKIVFFLSLVSRVHSLKFKSWSLIWKHVSSPNGDNVMLAAGVRYINCVCGLNSSLSENAFQNIYNQRKSHDKIDKIDDWNVFIWKCHISIHKWQKKMQENARDRQLAERKIQNGKSKTAHSMAK